MPEGQQAQLAEWLLGGMLYSEAQKQVKDQFGIEVKSLKSFSHFWEEVCVPALLRRRSQAVQTAESIAQEMQSRPGRFDQPTVDAIKQKAFELAISPQSHPKDVKALFMLLQKARDQEIKVQQIELERDKFKETIRSNIDRGLEALYLEIKSSQVAREIFEKLKNVVMKEVKAA